MLTAIRQTGLIIFSSLCNILSSAWREYDTCRTNTPKNKQAHHASNIYPRPNNRPDGRETYYLTLILRHRAYYPYAILRSISSYLHHAADFTLPKSGRTKQREFLYFYTLNSVLCASPYFLARSRSSGDRSSKRARSRLSSKSASLTCVARSFSATSSM